MKKKLYTSIGLMSGTSMDGIDVSIISSDGYDQLFNILDVYFEYDNKLQQELISLRHIISSEDDIIKNYHELNVLERKLTLFHADKVNQILLQYKDDVDLVGFHGQTIFHNSKKKITKQLGDGKLLSQIIKKRVVYDFRQADIENNGQGAPLTPIFHYILSKNIKEKHNIRFPLAFLNIGGIANVTKVNNISDDIKNNLLAFDIGPGNCLIDNWIRNNSSKKFDSNGEIARSGKIDRLIFNQAVENFEIYKYSRSLDIKDFDISFVRGLSLENGCATITNFTAYLIAKGLEYINNNNDTIKILICGGGRKNNFLIECINKNLTKNNKIILEKVENYGLNGDFIEAQAFGYLAIRSFLNLPISFSNTTGCKSPVVGGKLVKNY